MLFFVQKNQFILDILNFTIIPVFLVMGVNNLFRKDTNIEKYTTTTTAKNFDFIKGFSLGMLNPQLLPFWFFILIYLSKSFAISSLSEKYAFVLGTGFGAFGILAIFAYLAHRYQSYIKQRLQKHSINRITGYLFISLALIQIIKIFV